MSSCQHQEQLPELLYDALQPDESQALRGHIDVCQECRSEWGRLQATLALLDRAMPTPPAGMVDRTMAAIEREQTLRPGLWARFDAWLQRISRHRPTGSSWGIATALTLVLLVPVLYPNLVRFHSEGASAACRTNLRVLATALDRYADEHHGSYPSNLGEFVPRYVQKLPRCPLAGADTYTPGYRLSGDHLSFHLECAGHYHGSVAPFTAPSPR